MKKGLVIALVIVGVLLVIGLVYYFLIYKKEKSQREGTEGLEGTGTDEILSSPCVAYTQSQQDADKKKCMTACGAGFSSISCIMACDTNKKPVKSC